jgi:hypothetical protein
MVGTAAGLLSSASLSSYGRFRLKWRSSMLDGVLTSGGCGACAFIHSNVAVG